MKTTITADMSISAEFEHEMARQLQEDPEGPTAPKAWREVIRKLDHAEAPFHIVVAHGVFVAGMPFLSERYILTADGLKLDEADPSEWTLYTDLDEARRAVAETIVGPDRPRQVALVTLTY